MPNETLAVALGICLLNGTWRKEDVEFPIEEGYDPDLPEPETNRTLSDIAFDHWCVQQLPEGSSDEDKSNALSSIEEAISGYFVLEWRVKDSRDSEERPDRACDKDCPRRLAGNDSVECTCSRSRQTTEAATIFKVDSKIVEVGNDVRVEYEDREEGRTLIIVLTHEGIIMDVWDKGRTESTATSSITFNEKIEEMLDEG